MNQHVKAKISVCRMTADRLTLGVYVLELASTEAEKKAMLSLADQLRSEAASLEQVEPNPRNRQLAQRRVKMKELVGKKVRLLQTLRTKGGAEYKAGAIMTVEGHWRGRVNLSDGLRHPHHAGEFEPMPLEEASEKGLSGYTGYIRHVHVGNLELIE